MAGRERRKDGEERREKEGGRRKEGGERREKGEEMREEGGGRREEGGERRNCLWTCHTALECIPFHILYTGYGREGVRDVS